MQSYASSSSLSSAHKRRLSSGSALQQRTLKSSQSSALMTPAKFTNEFVHSGYNRSKRRGEIVVVCNNATARNSIRPSTSASSHVSGKVRQGRSSFNRAGEYDSRVGVSPSKCDSEAGLAPGVVRSTTSALAYEKQAIRSIASA